MSSSDVRLTLPLEDAIARTLVKQHLGVGSAGEDVLAVVDDLLGLHATVARSPYLQLRARMPTFAAGQLDALLDEGRAAKVACMRRTLFIESAESVPLVLAAARGLTLRDHDRFLAAGGLTRRRYEQLADPRRLGCRNGCAAAGPRPLPAGLPRSRAVPRVAPPLLCHRLGRQRDVGDPARRTRRGVWDLVAGRSPELRLCFFDAVEARTRRRVRALAADVAAFLTADTAAIEEVERMTPFTDRSSGRFLSPLSEPD